LLIGVPQPSSKYPSFLRRSVPPTEQVDCRFLLSETGWGDSFGRPSPPAHSSSRPLLLKGWVGAPLALSSLMGVRLRCHLASSSATVFFFSQAADLSCILIICFVFSDKVGGLSRPSSDIVGEGPPSSFPQQTPVARRLYSPPDEVLTLGTKGELAFVQGRC